MDSILMATIDGVAIFIQIFALFNLFDWGIANVVHELVFVIHAGQLSIRDGIQTCDLLELNFGRSISVKLQMQTDRKG
jgi:hypothetical protein